MFGLATERMTVVSEFWGIAKSKELWRAFGKDPSRHPPSDEKPTGASNQAIIIAGLAYFVRTSRLRRPMAILRK